MKEKPPAEKQSQDEVRYVKVSTHSGEFCSNCSMFIDSPRPRCTDVVGPIYSYGWCKIWKPE